MYTAAFGSNMSVLYCPRLINTWGLKLKACNIAAEFENGGLVANMIVGGLYERYIYEHLKELHT